MRTDNPHVHRPPSTVNRILQISIPEPCHEDWNEMSQREQGRFCDKCCKTVLDFSSKTKDEIKNFFLEHLNEKICGRFRKDQLNIPICIEIPYHPGVNNLSYSQAFFLSLLLVFGTTLFSCTTHNNEKVEKFELIENNIEKIDTPLETKVINTEQTLTGEVIEKTNSIRKITVESNAEKMPPYELPAVDIYSFKSEGHTVGGVWSTISVCSTPIIFDEPDSTVEEMKVIDPEEIQKETILFPNPAHNIVNLKFQSSSENRTTVEMFDLNGKLIRTLLPSQQLEDGENEIQFDVSDIPPATYLVRIVKGEKVETKRIVVM